MGVDMRVTVPRVIILLVVLLVLAELISYFSTSNGTDWQVFLAASVNFFILFLFFAFFVGAILFIFGRIKLPNSVEGKVKKLAKLKEAGIITEEEFEARKNKLLDQL
jgi:predicted membrane protein